MRTRMRLSVGVACGELLLVLLLQARAVAGFVFAPPMDEASYAQCPAAAALALNRAVAVALGNGGEDEEGAVFYCNSNSNDGYYTIERKRNTWYALVGTGEVLTASVCSSSSDGLLDAGLTVYRDECVTPSCADLFFSDGPGCPGLCVATSAGASSSTSNSNAAADCALSSSLSWRTELNRPYFVQVWQQRDSFPSIRQAGATATAEPCAGTAQLVVYESSPPGNLNRCGSARPLPQSGAVSEGALEGATTVVQPCAEGSAPGGDTDGLWYTFTAAATSEEQQQQLVQVPLCDGVRSVQVYTGAACDQLQCQSRYYIQSTESCSRNLVFPVSIDTVYYLYVVADNMLDFGFDFGGTVSLLPQFDPAPNQECAAAEALVADGTAQTVAFDEAFDWTQDYNPELQQQPALWYSLAAGGTTVANSNPHRVQICGPVQMQVSSGSSCSQLEAVDSVYLSSGCETRLLDPKEPTLWFLQLQALAGATHRPANLTVWALDRAKLAPNAKCQFATGPLSYNSDRPVAAALVDPIVEGGPQDMALFYYVERPADGNFLQGTVCRTSLGSVDFDVSLEQSSLEFCQSAAVPQSAGTLVSDIDENGCRSISWGAAMDFGEAILIIGVHAKEDLDFTIQVQEADASILPTNDNMPESYRLDNTGYVLLTLDNGPVQGSTANALSDDVDAFRGQYCENILPNKPGVWFATSPGTGQDTVVCLKSDSTSTAQLAVFGALLDVDVIYEGCLPDAEAYTLDSECTVALRWPALQDDLYSILVQTDGPESFELSMYTITDSIAEPACVLPTMIVDDSATTVSTSTPSFSLTPTESIQPSASIAPFPAPTIDATPPTTLSTDANAVGDEPSRGWARTFSWSCSLLSAVVLALVGL